MANGVRQDSAALKLIADYIDGEAVNFETKCNELFQELSEKLTESESDVSAWFGPQAVAFLESFNAKKTDFANAKTNITNMATNLREQAEAWEAFERV